MCLSVLQLLLDEHVDSGVRDREGMSPAMWACRWDRLEHCNLLSSYEQKNPNVTRRQDGHGGGTDDDGYERDLGGRTWLHWSVRRAEPLECLKVCQNLHLGVCCVLVVSDAVVQPVIYSGIRITSVDIIFSHS